MAGLEPKLRRGVYHAFGTVAGERIRKSLGTRDKRQAVELCAQYEAKLWKRRSYGEEAVRTFEEAALSYQAAGGERRFLPPLLKRFRGRVLGSIKPGEIKEAARAIYPQGNGATRNRQAVVPARAIINHAATLGWCSPIRVEPFPTEKTKRTAVDRAWIDTFTAQADADGLSRLSAAVLFMFQTGARVSEAARVMLEHVDLHNRIVLLERTKTSQWEARHITNELVIRIANLGASDGRPLFGYSSRFSINNRMKAVCARAGIPFVSPHQAGRHSFATNALAMGATPKEVMEAGGWKSARLVLEIYAHTENAGRTVADRFDANLAQSAPAHPQVTGKKGTIS